MNASLALITSQSTAFKLKRPFPQAKLPANPNATAAAQITYCPLSPPSRNITSHRRVVLHQAISAANGPESGTQTEDAKKTLSRLKTVSWISFWAQLALSIASAGVLLFTVWSTGKAGVSSLFLTAGVAASFISVGLVRVVLSKSRSILKGSNPFQGLREWNVSGLLLRNTDINLVGMGASIIALQGEIGLLVGKTLSSASINPYSQQRTAPAALDIFTVQGAANVLLAHFCSLFLLTFLLRALENIKTGPASG